MNELACAVVGAGAAGLAAALELQSFGRSVAVFEASDQPGGVIRSVRQDSYLYELGPNTIRVNALALGLLRRTGAELALQAAEPASRLRFLLGPSGLEPVPLGPLGLLRTPLLSAGGKLRLLSEPFRARGSGEAESVAEFIGRRLGPEAVEQLVGPFLVGVYAGDERQLGAEAVFPSLVAAEREHGSILSGLLRNALSGAERGLSGSFSAHGGLGNLVSELVRSLKGALHLESPVRELAPDPAGWRLQLEDREVRARSVVLAADAPAAARLLAPLDPEAGEFLAGLRYAPLASVPVAVDQRATAVPIRGFGFLVPRERKLELLGALFMSRLFTGRAPHAEELVMGLIGGERWPEVRDASDEQVIERVHQGLDRALGLSVPPRVLAVNRWERAVPQPGRGHVRAVRELRARLADRPGLALAGGYLDGVGVADAMASGMLAARRLVALQA
jgi:oxygen-dependent protoporphyrinogen oxidase